jgi:hypothetical protein
MISATGSSQSTANTEMYFESGPILAARHRRERSSSKRKAYIFLK